MWFYLSKFLLIFVPSAIDKTLIINGFKCSSVARIDDTHPINICWMNKVCAKLLQLCPALCDTMDYSPPGSLSMGFSRQGDWSGLPCPSPGDPPDPGIRRASLRTPALASGFFISSATSEALNESKWQHLKSWSVDHADFLGTVQWNQLSLVSLDGDKTIGKKVFKLSF